MIRFEAATVLLQWAAGGFCFLWVTTRRRMVGLGYGWLMRGVFASICALGLVAASRGRFVVERDVPAALALVGSLIALGVSIRRKQAGVQLQREAQRSKQSRVATMLGNGDSQSAHGADSAGQLPLGSQPETAAMQMRDQFGRATADEDLTFLDGPEFPPQLDLIAPIAALIGVIGAAVDAADGAPLWLAIARFLAGALFLGAVSDAMLLGHWYLVQPGLSRQPIHELNDWVLRLWPVEVILLLVPTGMIQAVTGEVADGWGGMLSWFWIACALTTGVLGFVTRIALRERYYSAVMAATGFLYLAILMAFCTDLIARAILS